MHHSSKKSRFRKNEYIKLAGLVSISLFVSNFSVAYASEQSATKYIEIDTTLTKELASSEYNNSQEELDYKYETNYKLVKNFSNAKEIVANAQNQRTDEFSARTGLDSINADIAYAMGYTGDGVSIGVIEEGLVDKNNPDLNSDNIIIVDDYHHNITKEKDNHATHVTGIIGAQKNGDNLNTDDVKDGINMHGTAYESNIYTYAIAESGNTDDKNIKFSKDIKNIVFPSNIKVVNESFGTEINIIEDSIVGKFLDSNSQLIKALNNKLLKNGTIIVKSIGNDAKGNNISDGSVLYNYIDNEDYYNNYVLV